MNTLFEYFVLTFKYIINNLKKCSVIDDHQLGKQNNSGKDGKIFVNISNFLDRFLLSIRNNYLQHCSFH